MGDILFSVLLLIPLGYGALMDYRHRIIPNSACCSVFIFGLLTMLFSRHDSSFFVPFWLRMAGVFPAILMFFIASFKGGIGGGDIKLMAALGFAIGFYSLVPVLLMTTLIALFWAIRKKQNSVPLGLFLFLGMFLFCVVKLGLNIIHVIFCCIDSVHIL